MYDPITARFMQEDTYLGQQNDPLSLNLYTYCHNSPLMYWDPTGHSAEATFGGQKLGANAAADNMAQREMRKVLNKWNPIASSVGDAARRSAAGSSNNGYSYSKKFETLSVTGRVTIADGVKESAAKALHTMSCRSYNNLWSDEDYLAAHIQSTEAATALEMSGWDQWVAFGRNQVVQPLRSFMSKTASGVRDKFTETATGVRDKFSEAVDSVQDFGIKVREDWENYYSNNQDPNVILNANIISSYKETPVVWIPEDFFNFGSNAFSFGGVIFLGAGMKTKYIVDPDKSTFIEKFMKTVNHEKGHAIEWDKDPVRFALTIAMPSFAHFQFDNVKVNEVLDVASNVSIINPSFRLSTEIAKQVVGSSPDIANAAIFDLMGWSPYYSYYEKPFEYGADSEGGGVLRTGNETVDIHAGEWYQTYSEASIIKTFYYNLNPQQLFKDSIEVNWHSYTREDYQYQQRTKYGHN